MNVGDQLRDVLNQEADMVNATRPDVEQLIIGGQTRKRRRTVTRAGGAALAAVLVGGGLYGFTQMNRDDAGATGLTDQPTATAEPSGATTPPTLAQDPGPGDLEPGTYRVLAGTDSAGAPIEADLTFDGPGWSAGNFPIVRDAESFGGLGVYRPSILAAGSGCTNDVVRSNVGESSIALAQQLAELPKSTVVQPITATVFLGQDAYHLRLRIPQTCPAPQAYRAAETPRGDRGITYDRPDGTYPPVVMDFWVLLQGGVPVVVDSWHQLGASSDLVDQITQARESIAFVTRD